MCEHNKILPDYGLIKPITIHPDSRVPYNLDEASTNDDYDLYFRLNRESLGLAEWTKNCTDIYENQRSDLENTDLSYKEKYEIALGWSSIFQTILENWLEISQSVRGNQNHE